MDLVTIATTLLVLALLGFIVYLITTYIPMPEVFKTLIMVACAVLIIFWLIGLLTGRNVFTPHSLGGLH